MQNLNKQSFLGAFVFFGILIIIASTVHAGGPGFLMGCWTAAFLIFGVTPIFCGWWMMSAVVAFWWFIAFVGFMVYMGGWHQESAEKMWETLRWYFSWFDWLVHVTGGDKPREHVSTEEGFVKMIFWFGVAIVCGIGYVILGKKGY